MKENELNRGNLLWESSRMFLPEHREQLLEQRRSKKGYQPPELDEQRLEEMNQMLEEALHNDRVVIVSYAQGEFYGFVEEIAPHTSSILVVDGEHRKRFLSQEILDIQWA